MQLLTANVSRMADGLATEHVWGIGIVLHCVFAIIMALAAIVLHTLRHSSLPSVLPSPPPAFTAPAPLPPSKPSNYKWCSAQGKMAWPGWTGEAAALRPVNGNRNSCKWQLAQFPAAYTYAYLLVMHIGTKKHSTNVPRTRSHSQHEQLTLANCRGRSTKSPI